MITQFFLSKIGGGGGHPVFLKLLERILLFPSPLGTNIEQSITVRFSIEYFLV